MPKLFFLSLFVLMALVPVEALAEDVPTLIELADGAYRDGSLEEAEQLYREALAMQPRALDAQLALANFLIQKGRHEEAMRHFKAVLKQDPAHATALRGLRSVLSFMGMYVDALAVNQSLLEQFPDGWTELYAQAGILTNLGKYQKAREILERVLIEKPDLFHARIELCGIYLRQGQPDLCKDYILKENPEEVEDLNFCWLRATYHMKKQEFSRAEKWILRALEIAPHSSGSFMSLKYVNDKHLGRIVLDEVRKREEGQKVSLDEHYYKAMRLLGQGNLGQAQSKIRWLMHFYPQDQDLQMYDALIEGYKGNLDTAIHALEKMKSSGIKFISVRDDVDEQLKELVRMKQFQERVMSRPWEEAEEIQTKYFDLQMNIAPPYREKIIGSVDEDFRNIYKIIEGIFGEKPEKRRIRVKIFADMKSFRIEARDYLFADAVFFAGAYTKEQRTIYYHFQEELEMSGLVHELAHILVGDMMANTPTWLNEGIAEYVSMQLSPVDFLERKLMAKNYLKQLARFENIPTVDFLVRDRSLSIESYILWRALVQFFFEFKQGYYLPQLRQYIHLLSTESFESDPFTEAFAGYEEQLQNDWELFFQETWPNVLKRIL